MAQPTANDFTIDERRRPDGHVAESGLGPAKIKQQLRGAYGDRVPGSGRRWLDQREEREWAARVPRCATCGKRLPSSHVRWCSAACRSTPRPSPAPAEIVAEMHAALDRLREVVG